MTVPILGRAIPVIADEYVDREFGTGALKITPGHDPNDYEIGMRHNLPVLSMLDREAKVTEVGGPYAGMDRFDCRKKMWADMKEAGLVVKEEPYTLNVPRSQRGGEIVEPMISTQWFVEIAPLAEKGAGCSEERRHPHCAGTLREGLLQLAGEHQGLVHQPPVVVGTPHPGLVLRGLQRADRDT